MNKNYYEKLIEELEKLIKQNNKDEAIKLLEEEFKLPYIPSIYESKLIEIYNSINKNLKPIKNINFSKEEILVILLDEYKKHSINFLVEVASLMNEFNWINNIKEIQSIFKNQNLDSKVKCTIYNNLVLQKLDHDFVINNKTINPLKNKTTFETEFFLKNINKLNADTNIEPSIREIMTKLLFLYVMNNFPNSLFFEPIDLSLEFFNICQVMLGQKQEDHLSLKEKQIYLDIKSYN